MGEQRLRVPAAMADGIVKNKDGAVRHLLLTTDAFTSADIARLGGKLEWQWRDAGIVVASSSQPTSFRSAAEKNKAIRHVLVEKVVHSTRPARFSTLSPASAPAHHPVPHDAKPLDAYEANLQWPLQAIGATRPRPLNHAKEWIVDPSTGATASTTFSPEWKLDDLFGSGVTIGTVDSGIPALSTGQMHPDMHWYGGADHEGGIVPMFRSRAEYADYHARFPGGGLPVPSSVHFDDVTALLGMTGSGLVFEHGMVGNELRVIIDPLVGGLCGTLDPLFGIPCDYHSNSTTGLIGARRKQGTPGAMRGLAPQAKLVCYNAQLAGIIQLPEKTIHAFHRAASVDRCDVLAFLGGYIYTNDDDGRMLEAIMLAAFDALRTKALVSAPAGNWGIDNRRAQLHPAGAFVFPQSPISGKLPNVLCVSGTGPRDYDPFSAELPAYDPSDGKGRERNLDRPGVYTPPEIDPTSTTSYGAGYVDIAAPAGAIPDGAVVTDPGDGGPWTTLATDCNGTILPFTTVHDPAIGQHAWGGATSQSEALVAGVAALVVQAYERAHGRKPTPVRLREILVMTADANVGPPSDVINDWLPGDDAAAAQNNVVLDLMTLLQGPDAPGFAEALARWSRVEVTCDPAAFYGAGRVNARRAVELAEAVP